MLSVLAYSGVSADADDSIPIEVCTRRKGKRLKQLATDGIGLVQTTLRRRMARGLRLVRGIRLEGDNTGQLEKVEKGRGVDC